MTRPPDVSADTQQSTAKTLIAVLALLTAVAPLAIDMYLPAFPEIAGELGTSATGVQLTLTTFLLGLGVGQLLIGPISDSVGRRGPLLIGSLVCVGASIACALAPDAAFLAVARAVQGLSGAAGVVLARAMISDTARGAGAARLQGVLMVINVVAPVIAPLSGGAIIAASGWRAVFWGQAGLALVMFFGALVYAQETLPQEQRVRGGVGATLRTVADTLKNRSYLGYLFTFCLSFAALFAYIAASPFVMQGMLGLSSGAYSLLFGLNALVIVITSAVAAALAGKVPYRRMIGTGLTAGFLAAAGLLVLSLDGVPMVATLVLFALFQGSMGLVFSNATALALEQAGANAGTGSAFLGFLQFMLAALISPLVGIGGEGTAVPMGVAMLTLMFLAMAAFTLLRARASSEENAGQPA